MQRTRGIDRLGRLAAAIAALALVAAACGGSAGGGTEYEDPNERALFVLPEGWNLYGPDELTSLPFVPFGFAYTDTFPIVQQVAFDGAPGRDPSNLTVSTPGAAYPVGTFTIRSVGTTSRDFLSRGLLKNAVVPSEVFTIGDDLLAEDIDFGRDYEGIRRFIPFQDENTEEQGVVYFITVTNPDDTAIYTIAAGCSTTCFETFQDDIQGVVDSWIVNTRQ